jgi:hypothetical protein
MNEKISETVFYLGGKKTERKQILAYWVRHTENQRHYFKWDWRMIWILVKYRVIWGMDISFTVTKSIDREEYFVEFYAE